MDQTTVLSDAHATVIKHLLNRGIGYMEEIDFPPYRVDCYLPDWHAVIEVDGPQHSMREIHKRDRALDEIYGLPVFHIGSGSANRPDLWMPGLLVFLTYSALDALERRAACEDKCPWI